MRFLFLNQFYPPDPAPTGRYLHEVATLLVRRGHAVRVVCSRRGYAAGEDLGPGRVDAGVEVIRVGGVGGRTMSGRVVGQAIFLAQAIRRAALGQPRPDLVLAATSPPFLGMAGALAARWRNTAHAEWIMDVYPDVILAHWRINPSDWRARSLDALARFQRGRASLILTLGQYMSARIGRVLPDRAVLQTVPLWDGTEAGAEESASAKAWRVSRKWSGDDLVLLYSGNMGRGHRFDEFLEAARRLGPDGPRWVFVGGGPRRGEVEAFQRRNPEARVDLLPSVATLEVTASLLSADVHLVSLREAWQGLMVPSKLQAAFGLGRPVIFVGAADNEVAAWIRESGGGWVVNEGDVEALIHAVGQARDAAERAKRGAAARRFARLFFDRETNCARIADLLERFARPPAGAPERPSITALR